MVEYIICFAIALLVAFCATPAAKKISFKLGAVDIPKDGRRMHKRPIARLGGLAIISGFFVSILFNIVSAVIGLPGTFTPDTKLMGLLGGLVIIIAVGIIDDIRPINAKVKFVFQLVAAVVVVATGTRIESVTNPFASGDSYQFSAYISYPISILWIVGITNAINLIDGLDGLAAGVSSISSLTLFCVSILAPEAGSAAVIASVTAALAGATLGFLPYNFNPAKIFMGDTGATFLGFTLGVISIQGMLKSYAAIAIAIPILALGLPLFDTLFAILRRLFSGKSIMEADRKHLHHRLIDMGLSHKQSVVVMYAVSLALGLCAIVLVEKGTLGAIILIIVISVFIFGGFRYMSEINSDWEEEKEYPQSSFRDASAGRSIGMVQTATAMEAGEGLEGIESALGGVENNKPKPLIEHSEGDNM